MNIWTIKKGTPQIATHSFIAPGAQIIGEVIIGSGSSVWHKRGHPRRYGWYSYR